MLSGATELGVGHSGLLCVKNKEEGHKRVRLIKWPNGNLGIYYGDNSVFA